MTLVEAPGKVILDADAISRTLCASRTRSSREPRARLGRPRRHPHSRHLRRPAPAADDRERAGAVPDLGTLDITFDRDDVRARAGSGPRHAQPVVRTRGSTSRSTAARSSRRRRPLHRAHLPAAIEALFEYGRPARVQLACSLTRPRELPIRPTMSARTCRPPRRVDPGRAPRDDEVDASCSSRIQRRTVTVG